ncbi:MAG: DUF3618 domain-containing protein [Chloroflexota bacterium]|nr:DUF3618 domain-containing protein [Chloroflexota bacterium]
MTDTNRTNDTERGQVDPTEEQIVVEIEATRTQMSGTIDEIGHRLNPQTIADQAREQLREATVGRVERLVEDAGQTAQQTSNSIMQTIRQNPVPAAMAAIGIGWLVVKARESGGNGGRHASYRYRTTDYGYPYSGGAQARSAGGRDIGATVASAGDDMRQRTRDIGQQAQRAATDAAERSQEAIEQAQWQLQNTVGQAQSQVQNTVGQAQREFDRMLDENPLALGAIAVGVGAAVALALPETQRERELMGEQRDQLVAQVEEKATQALDEAEKKARETGSQLREQATEG